MFTSEVAITATAGAVHPPGVLLDEHGCPVLDADGEPVQAAEQLDEQDQETRR